MKSLLTKKNILLGSILTSVGITANYAYKSYKTKNHLSSVYSFDTLIDSTLLNKRILSCCGDDVSVKSMRVVDANDYVIILKANVAGLRSNSKLDIKLKKVSHAQLRDNSKKQQFLSICSKNEKPKVVCIPVNFNYPIVPTKETIEKYSKDSGINSYIQYLDSLKYDKNTKFKDSIFEYDIKDCQNKLEDTDTFWALSQVHLEASEETAYLIFPIPSQNRNYNIEDTYYKFETFADCLRNIEVSKLSNFSQKAEIMSKNDIKKDLTTRKVTSLLDQQSKRKKIVFFNIFAFCIGVIIFSRFKRTRLRIESSSAIKKVINFDESVVTNLGGYYNIMYNSYKYNSSEGKYYLKSYAVGPDAKAELSSQLEHISATNSMVMTNMEVNIKKKNSQEVIPIKINKREFCFTESEIANCNALI